MFQRFLPLKGGGYVTEAHDEISRPSIDLKILAPLLGERLDQKDKELFNDYFYNKVTQKELCKKYGISQSTLSERISKLETKVIEILENAPEFDFDNIIFKKHKI